MCIKLLLVTVGRLNCCEIYLCIVQYQSLYDFFKIKFVGSYRSLTLFGIHSF